MEVKSFITLTLGTNIKKLMKQLMKLLMKQPNLMFSSKAGAYPMGATFKAGSGPTRKHYSKLTKDKHLPVNKLKCCPWQALTA